MAGESFGEILTEFKNRESAESVFPMLNDVALCNAVLAWKSVSVRYKSTAPCPHDDEQAQWRWMWENVEYDVESFGVVAGCKPQEAAIMLTRLIGLRLIYPDGSICQFAKQYLGRRIMQALTAKDKPKDKPKSE